MVLFRGDDVTGNSDGREHAGLSFQSLIFFCLAYFLPTECLKKHV